MRRWLGKTFGRIIVSVLVLSLLAAAITWWPAHQAKNLIKRQLQLTSQTVSQLQQSLDILNSLPSLSQQNLRKQGALQFYANQAERGSVQFKSITIVRPSAPAPILGLSTSGESRVISSVNDTIASIHSRTIYTNSRNDSQAAAKLLRYHAAVSLALVSLLEYDPVVDTQGFNLKTSDTQRRLQLAYDGLIKTDQSLQSANKLYNDPTIDELTALVSRLRYARYDLSQTGDVAVWIAKVEDAQAKILANRQAFWSVASTKATSKLKADKSKMEFIHQLWLDDAKNYGVT